MSCTLFLKLYFILSFLFKIALAERRQKDRKNNVFISENTKRTYWDREGLQLQENERQVINLVTLPIAYFLRKLIVNHNKPYSSTMFTPFYQESNNYNFCRISCTINYIIVFIIGNVFLLFDGLFYNTFRFSILQ